MGFVKSGAQVRVVAGLCGRVPVASEANNEHIQHSPECHLAIS